MAKGIADDIAPLIAAQPGCGGVTVFGDDSDGQYGIFVLWDTRDNADAAAEIVGPKLEAQLAGHVQGPPEARLFEVLSG